jgi:ribonuclease P protein component
MNSINPPLTPRPDPDQKQLARQFGLSSAQRLKTPSDFQLVYGSKQWGGSKYFTFNVLANDVDVYNTLGVTVSKKVSKRAVDRNHLKRVMREFYRLRQAELHGVNLVLTAKPASKLANSSERLKSLEELWVKVLKWQRWHKREQAKALLKSGTQTQCEQSQEKTNFKNHPNHG